MRVPSSDAVLEIALGDLGMLSAQSLAKHPFGNIDELEGDSQPIGWRLVRLGHVDTLS